MTFTQSISSVFSKYATFSGRASRSEYWYFVLFEVLVYIGFGIVAYSCTGRACVYPMWLNILYGLFGLLVLLPSLAVSVRRMHDIGKGGGWIFIALVPLVGQIWYLVLMLLPGDAYANRFGEQPS